MSTVRGSAVLFVIDVLGAEIAYLYWEYSAVGRYMPIGFIPIASVAMIAAAGGLVSPIFIGLSWRRHRILLRSILLGPVYALGVAILFQVITWALFGSAPNATTVDPGGLLVAMVFFGLIGTAPIIVLGGLLLGVVHGTASRSLARTVRP